MVERRPQSAARDPYNFAKAYFFIRSPAQGWQMFFAHRIIEMSNCAPAAVRRGADRLGAKGVGGMRFTKTLRFRLIVVTVLCTAVVSLVGNLALFGYLNNILTQRADRIDEIYLSTLQNQLDEYLTDLSDLAILCSSDYTVSRALSPAATMKNAVDAQDRLNARLRRIAANDFSFDPEIEKPQDELGQIGRTVNEMSMSIQHLLRETEEMYTQRRNIEIALLQSQVNPHFLYNTLDSIRWMAVIQKNPGIASITHSLSNLLKNIAKGTQDKITLAEELGLLQDYIAIQAVR